MTSLSYLRFKHLDGYPLTISRMKTLPVKDQNVEGSKMRQVIDLFPEAFL